MRITSSLVSFKPLRAAATISVCTCVGVLNVYYMYNIEIHICMYSICLVYVFVCKYGVATSKLYDFSLLTLSIYSRSTASARRRAASLPVRFYIQFFSIFFLHILSSLARFARDTFV